MGGKENVERNALKGQVEFCCCNEKQVLTEILIDGKMMLINEAVGIP
jgi:hypothetical protein